MIAQNQSLHALEIDDGIPGGNSTVFVVDPDPSTGKMVKDLLQGDSSSVQLYTSGRTFLETYDGEQSGCLVLEQRIFDISGLQLQQRLNARQQRVPMVFVTAGLDVSTAVVLMRGGATNVLEKPLRPLELLGAIQEAVGIDVQRRRQAALQQRVKDSIALLTRKERQLVGLVACAKPTKAIAEELSIGSRAVELRRRAVMNKLGFKSSLELIRFAVLACQECREYVQCEEPMAKDRNCRLVNNNHAKLARYA